MGRLNRRLLGVTTAVCTALLSTSAWANLSIDKLWVEFAPGQAGRNDVVVRNDGTDRYYIDVSVEEVVNPGTEEEERRVTADPEARGLLVTPNRIVLEPGALRSIRLVSLNEDLPQDRIYRVLIKPEIGALVAPEKSPDDDAGVNMKLLAAYEVLVIARPKDAQAQIEAERADKILTLSNSGNTNILIAEGTICPRLVSESEPESGCRSIPATRLYSGNKLTLDLNAPDDRVEIKVRDTVSMPVRSIRL